MVTNNCHHFFYTPRELLNETLKAILLYKKKHILRYAFYIILALGRETSSLP